jgi:major structural subunit of bundle-forming pilus
MEKKMSTIIKLKQRGLTIVESAMALAIMSLVLAGVIVFYQMASMNSKINETTNEITELNETIRNVYTAAANYSTLDNAAMIGADILPTGMVQGTNIYNAFNGEIILDSANFNGGNDNSYYMTLNDLPEKACSEIALTNFGRNLVGIRIGSVEISLPATPSDVTNECNNGDNNTIRLHFL